MESYNTRAQVLHDFTVDETGTITNPGKFEGEMLYAPVFYYACQDGCGEEMDGMVRFEIEETDYAEFPELEGFQYVDVKEDDNGFFYCSPHN